MDERLKQAIRPDTASNQNLCTLRVCDGLGCGDVAGVDAQAVAVAGDVVIGRIVERTGLGADAVQAGDGRVVGGREDAALVVDADAAERGPGALVVLGDIERAGLNGRQIPGVGVELLVDTGSGTTAYRARNLVLATGLQPSLPPGVVAATRERYLQAYERLTGSPFVPA